MTCTSVLLNEVDTFAQVARGIRAGFNAVMLGTGDVPYAENVLQQDKLRMRQEVARRIRLWSARRHLGGRE